MRQKVDGLMDITAREAGTFYTPGRTTLVAAGTGGAQDIADWDDTTLTAFTAQLDYAVAKAWTLTAGYWYEKYDFKDAYTAGDELMPQAVLIFLKSNKGAYDANVFYAGSSRSDIPIPSGAARVPRKARAAPLLAVESAGRSPWIRATGSS